jgi:hypothetical protein
MESIKKEIGVNIKEYLQRAFHSSAMSSHSPRPTKGVAELGLYVPAKVMYRHLAFSQFPPIAQQLCQEQTQGRAVSQSK